jgi:hypothetical protein
MDEVSGRDAMETAHPTFQAAVIRIDVLNMKSACVDTLSGLGMYHPMGDATAASEGGVHAGTVRAEDRRPVDHWCEGFLDMLGIELAQQKIGRVAFSIAHHHHGNLFGACVSCLANATALAQ